MTTMCVCVCVLAFLHARCYYSDYKSAQFLSDRSAWHSRKAHVNGAPKIKNKMTRNQALGSRG